MAGEPDEGEGVDEAALLLSNVSKAVPGRERVQVSPDVGDSPAEYESLHGQSHRLHWPILCGIWEGIHAAHVDEVLLFSDSLDVVGTNWRLMCNYDNFARVEFLFH